MGRVLGLDYGRKRIGAAISDPGRSIASPLEVYARRDPVQNARHYQAIVAEHDVDRIVVGLPLHTSGRIGELARETRAWGDWLAQATGRPVQYVDERYTSVEADQILRDSGVPGRKRRDYRDMLAARLILQNYLDDGCPVREAPLLPLDDPTTP